MRARLSSPGVKPRTRIAVAVAAAALAAAAATVGVTALTSDPKPGSLCPDGRPLELDLGVRTDREAEALRQAQVSLQAGDRGAAARTLVGFDSLEAQIGRAVLSSPGETIDQLERLAASHPASGVVRLHLGFAWFCSGRRDEARRAWRAARRVEPDSAAAIRATDLLHPEYPIPGVPTFVPGFGTPAGVLALPPDRQLSELARRARRGGVRAKLLYGVALQRLVRRPRSAERQYAAAAALAPNDPEAQVAAAVGRFDKDRPAAAFRRLGPLTRRFPRAPTVRFHLGLLLLWLGEVDEGKRELARARALAPSSPLGREAARLLARLVSGSNGTRDE